MKRRNFLWYSLLFVAGCTAGTNSPTGGGSSPEALRLAVTDVQGQEDLERDYGPFRHALEEVLERPVEFFPVNSYTEAVPALQLGQVDLVLTGPSEYVPIRARTNAVPLTGITRPNYHAAIAVSSKIDIKSLAELKGKTIAMVSTRAKLITYRTGKMPVLRANFYPNIFAYLLKSWGHERPSGPD